MNEKPSYANAITDVIFIMLPFIVLILIKVMQNDLPKIIYTSDYALASSIMFGQLLAKTLSVPDKVKKAEQFRLFQVIIFAFSLIAITTYVGLQIIDDVADYIYYTQIVVFLIGIIFYIPLLTLMNKKAMA